MRLLLLSVCFVFVCFTLQAQTKLVKLVGIPEMYASPDENTFYATPESGKGSTVKKSARRSRTQAWLVFIDRVDVYACPYARSCHESSQISAKYKDWFYVLEENGDWLKLGKAVPFDKLKARMSETDVLGWVKKENLLLWNSSLKGRKSPIRLKAFVLNTVKEVEAIFEGKEREDAVIYKSPKIDARRDRPIKIYDFYFIYKKEEDNSAIKYLIGRSPTLNTMQIEEDLVGWISEGAISEWNTRIAFEPNFNSFAFKERQESKNLLVRGYEFADVGKVANGNTSLEPIWDKDPVSLSKEKLAKEYEGTRFKGGVVRFPLIQHITTNNLNVYKTGVVGDIILPALGKSIDELDFNELVSEVREYQRNLEKFKILFFIEGNESLLEYRSVLSDLIDEIDKNLTDRGVEKEFGVSVYRDFFEDEKKAFENIPLTASTGRVKEFINNITFNNWGNNDPHTNMHYGIKRGIRESSLSPNDPSTNIFIFIGNYGDLLCDKITRESCRENPACGNDYLIKREELASLISQYKPHMLFVQPKDDGSSASDCYREKIATHIMKQVANKAYYPFTGVSDWDASINLQPPFYNEETGMLENGVTFGKLIKGRKNGFSLSNDQIQKAVLESLEDAYNTVQQLQDLVYVSTSEASGDVARNSAGGFSPQISARLEEIAKNAGIDVQELYRILIEDKYKLYEELYIPARMPNAEYDALKPVIFVSHRELSIYNTIVRDLNSVRDQARNVKKAQIEKTFREAYITLTGNESLDMREVNYSDIHPIATGLCKEMSAVGKADIRGWWNCSFKQILDMDDRQLVQFIDLVGKNNQWLRRIYDQGLDYEFAYTLGTYPKSAIEQKSIIQDKLYYWIPLDEFFEQGGSSGVSCGCK